MVISKAVSDVTINQDTRPDSKISSKISMAIDTELPFGDGCLNFKHLEDYQVTGKEIKEEKEFFHVWDIFKPYHWEVIEKIEMNLLPTTMDELLRCDEEHVKNKKNLITITDTKWI